MASDASASVIPAHKDESTAQELDKSRLPESSGTEDAKKDKEERNIEEERCGVWSLGPTFADETKVRAALDRLGPFLLESCSCPLEVFDRDCALFDSDDEGDAPRIEGDEVASTQLRGLQELQLNDVVDDGSVHDRSTSSDSEPIEEVSDNLFESRAADGEVEVVGQQRSKRKRKAFETGTRDNFVKHDLRRKKKRFRGKQTKRTRKIKNKSTEQHTYKGRQEEMCLSKA